MNFYLKRLTSQRFRYAYSEDMPLEQVIIKICDLKQSYTQYGGYYI